MKRSAQPLPSGARTKAGELPMPDPAQVTARRPGTATLRRTPAAPSRTSGGVAYDLNRRVGPTALPEPFDRATLSTAGSQSRRATGTHRWVASGNLTGR